MDDRFTRDNRKKEEPEQQYSIVQLSQDSEKLTMSLSITEGPPPEQIRLYIPDTNNFGHQATCITVLYRLIEIGYTTIRIIYADAYEGHPVWPKLVTLISGLPTQKVSLHKLCGATLLFNTYLEYSEPAFKRLGSKPDLDLCVTGAFDSSTELVPNTNVDYHLHARAFIVLQPCQWFEYKAVNAIYLPIVKERDRELLISDMTNDDPSFGENFWQRGYSLGFRSRIDYRPDLLALKDPAPTKHRWLSRIIELQEKALIDLCPIYFTPGRIMVTPDALLFNLIAGLACCNRARKATRPSVIALLGEVTAESYLALQKFLDKLPSDIARRLGPLPKITVLLPDQCASLDLGDVCGQDGIVIVPLGSLDQTPATKGVPRTVFDHLFQIATLPRIFEGKGTLNLALNLGLPFLHLISAEFAQESNRTNNPKIKPVYPKFCVPENLAGMSPLCHGVCDELNLGQFGWTFKIMAGKDTPETSLGNFLLKACDENTNELKEYFAALGKFYSSMKEDKLEIALELAKQLLYSYDHDGEEGTSSSSNDEETEDKPKSVDIIEHK